MPHRTQPVIEIRTSSRRRTTGVAYWEGGAVVVVIPARLAGEHRDRFVDQLVTSLLRKGAGLHASDDALARRAADLADRYLDGVRPSSIRWSTRQRKRWGSCTTQTGEIRISASLQTVPEWVLDAVLVHELAHLIEPNHSPRFHGLIGRYERNTEAECYLKGYVHGLRSAGVPALHGAEDGDDGLGGGPAEHDPDAPEARPAAASSGPVAACRGRGSDQPPRSVASAICRHDGSAGPGTSPRSPCSGARASPRDPRDDR